MVQQMILLAVLVGMSSQAWAEETKAPAPAIPQSPVAPVDASTTDAESVEVSSIKEKYWARGNETEMGVIQNRLYSKAKKIQIGVLGGNVSSDPFLNTQLLGGNIGFHISEYFAVEVIGMKFFAGPSSALEVFKKFRGATANTNLPISYYGAEVMGSFLYGKLSLIGQSIIYYDLHLLAGGGMTKTESGNSVTIAPGIGQRFYINRFMSIRTDYRLLRYNETILEKEIPTKIGQPLGDRINWSHTASLGIDFMLGVGGAK